MGGDLQTYVPICPPKAFFPYDTATVCYSDPHSSHLTMCNRLEDSFT
jgi:hypothetical protein